MTKRVEIEVVPVLATLHCYVPSAARGLYRRVHICAAVVVCPHCGALAGRPCMNGQREISETHYSRRDAFRKIEPRGQ